MPTIREWTPLGAAPGERVALEVRGERLDGASSLVFEPAGVPAEGIEPTKEGLRVTLAIPADAAPGPLRFRVVTPRGISGPGTILVGRAVPRVAESEPNDGFSQPQRIEMPAAVDGALRDGDDVDVYAVEVEAGATLVAEVVAERAGSGLDALVTIFDTDGRELAASDDLFGRDAAAWATSGRSGRHLVAVQDAEGRIRDGNVENATKRPYRLVVGALPLAASAYPAGARRGETTSVHLIGANIRESVAWAVPPDAAVGDARLPIDGASALAVRVGESAEFVESEHEPAGGDVDLFRLVPESGRGGDYRIRLLAGRIGSPADPALAVVDPRGEGEELGTKGTDRDIEIVRHLDPEGVILSVREAFGRGGPRFVYRIEVEPAPPGVAATADLGACTIPRGGSLAVPVAVARQGYDGPLSVLAGPLPPGVTAAPVTIGAGARGGVLVLSALGEAPLGPFALRLVARDSAVPVTFVGLGRGGSPPGALTLAVAEPAPLGLSIEPAVVVVAPGGQAEVRVRLDRRGDAAGKPVKVRLLAGDGGLDGFEEVKETAVAADASEATFTLKAMADALPRRLNLSARAWFGGSPETLGVDAPAAMLDVPARP